ncbi:hypothetical protein [Cellvibrio sp. QJXJ]|uniref:hypothetical protein n=1 Tax=Cellvibrio sp. QJXJ TaxID=2964606 RepID=UPI0021C2E7EC|nr:hypothetical protein [Cellvibrio sp. QJXJ]UUA72069.1 hypothetical protein NNX04_16815 [Cellvibrio sp. QJXJ]
MTVIDMYKCTDSVSDMVQSLIDDGLIGISGGRVNVRKVLDELISGLNRENNDNEGYMSTTYNHPGTELGYAWDTARFSLSEAKSIVLKNYS